jgi:2-polyprenyl-3-methyl-5-hydroxy-6-metoxy-1,4-benzoquinol methylase
MTHWTEELFKENPELFIGAFEERLEQAQDEVADLMNCLIEQGFHPKRILDLNCGIGRHSIELGKHGIELLGTDLSTEYIAVARERAKEEGLVDKVHFRVADMRQIAPALRREILFDGVVCLWTSFGFYGNETNISILSQCLSLVREGGFFALEIINRDWIVQNFQEQGFTRWQDWIVLEERHFNAVNSRSYNTWTFLKQKDKETYIMDKVVNLDHRIWSLHELIGLLEKAGWQFKAAYPGFAPGAIGKESSFSPQSEEILQSKMLLVIGYHPKGVK